MANKQQAIDYLTNKVGDDETVFVLRAQDVFAPSVIRAWIELVAAVRGRNAKVTEALDTAIAMERWSYRKVPD